MKKYFISTLLIFLSIVSFFVFREGRELIDYHVIEAKCASIIKILPIREDEILIQYSNGKLECRNIKENISYILSKEVEGVKDTYFFDSDYVGDDFAFCVYEKILLLDTRKFPYTILGSQTNDIIYDSSEYSLALSYIPEYKIALIFESENVNGRIKKVYYADLKKIFEGEYKNIEFEQVDAERISNVKLSDDEIRYISLVRDKLNEESEGEYCFFPSKGLIVGKNSSIEIFNIKNNEITNLPNVIRFNSEKRGIDQLELWETILSIRIDNKSTKLLTPLSAYFHPIDCVTIWDIVNKKDILSFDMNSKNYMDGGTILKVEFSKTGNYVAVLYSKEKRRFFSDNIDVYYLDIWDLNNVKCTHTIPLPLPLGGESFIPHLIFSWNVNEHSVFLWDANNISDAYEIDFDKK